jgi:hypothetical protein
VTEPVDPRLVQEIEEALTTALPYVDSFHLGDVAVCVAEAVWVWLAEGDPT